jgi:ABC-type amino acid transport substrate-binding protein
MHALGRRLGVTMVVVPVSWFELEKGLLQGRYDLILSSWTHTPETPKGIVWTVSYGEWGLLVVVRADEAAVHSLGDLPENARIGHFPDPSVERALTTMARHARVRLTTRDAPDLLFDDLRDGKLDALIYDSVYVQWRVAQAPGFRIIGEPLNKLGYQVGLREEDVALLDRIQTVLKDLLSSGEIGKIRATWMDR